jgi:sugar lactone lactonase YvrE
MSAHPERVMDHCCLLGEAPGWDDRERRLLFVDILRGHVHWYDPENGKLETVDIGISVGAAAPRACGGDLVLALANGFATFDPAAGSFGPLHPFADEGLPGSRLNDGKCDPAGRFWAGTRSDLPEARRGGLYRFDPDGTVTTILRGVGTSNGLDWSEDGRTFYYIDSAASGVDAFDFDLESGALYNRRRFVDIAPEDGTPDGMTVDTEGGIWVALLGGAAVRRYTRDGRLDLVIRFPVSLVTSCAFAGPKLDQLYVTTAAHRLSRPEALAGALFRCETGFRGRPFATYAG